MIVHKSESPSICILLPAKDEGLTVGKTIHSFKEIFPTAIVIVGINNCSDNTEAEAISNNASCIYEERPGKGRILKALFELSPDADIYIMCDADNT